ncbi:MAG TPA: hypothetical protein VFM21_02520 [Terriglobia bacterium]|nr:hypothetical protein [Terriglobia bacterium]
MKSPCGFYRLSLLLGLALFVTAALGANAAADDDQPTIAKDSIRITFQTGRSGAYEKPGWVPAIEFRVNGPIASGSTLSVAFTLPSKGPWVSFDCRAGETEKGHWWNAECGGESIPNDKAVVYTGPVSFSIRMHNELAGTDVTLFTGKAKVGKTPPPPGSGANYQYTSSEFYTEDDWRIPIGYVFFEKDSGHMDQSFLHVLFWYRGNPAETEAHLFYKGKDVAKCEVPGNGPEDWNPKKPQWSFADCSFVGVYPAAPSEDEGYDPKFELNSNPGDYEVKVLLVGHLARSIKFTVGAGGKFDNGIAGANKLGSDRVIVPVQVIGSAESWDKAAWKTDAFYGNPLTGFTAGQ